MRIDEVIQEAPVGYGQRLKNFAQSKIGLTRDSRARGQGARDVSQIANNVSAEVNQKVGQAGIDINDMNQVLSQKYKDLVLVVLKDMGFAPEYATLYTKEWEKLLGRGSKYMDDTGKIPKTNSVKAAGGAQKLADQVLLNMLQQAAQSGLIFKRPDSDGDGKPDVGSDGSPDAQPGGNMGDAEKVNNNAASAVQNALDKLDPDLQAYAFRYLQNKARS